jgi:hypothetical protein
VTAGRRVYPVRPIYFARDGSPMTQEEWSVRLVDLAYKHVAVTAVDDDVEVSTVWLGLDHRFVGDGPPLIFETLIFGGPLDGEMWRYANEDAALAGHDQAVAACREAKARPR